MHHFKCVGGTSFKGPNSRNFENRFLSKITITLSTHTRFQKPVPPNKTQPKICPLYLSRSTSYTLALTASLMGNVIDIINVTSATKIYTGTFLGRRKN
jgi:hypothetical protein